MEQIKNIDALLFEIKRSYLYKIEFGSDLNVSKIHYKVILEKSFDEDDYLVNIEGAEKTLSTSEIKAVIDEARVKDIIFVTFLNAEIYNKKETAYDSKYYMHIKLNWKRAGVRLPRGMHIHDEEVLAEYINNHNVSAHISEDAICPLGRKYSNTEFRLSKVVYEDTECTELGFAKYRRVIREVEYALHDLETGRYKHETIRLTAKEVIENMIFGHGRLDKEDRLLESSGFRIISRRLILDTDELNKHRGKVKLVKVDNTEKMENWANRISMTGLVQNIKYSGTELSSIETSLKTLRIPEFVYINIFAFDRASIKDLIVSSDNTVILPRYYRNSDDKIINITYENNHSAAFSSYSLDSFRNSLIQTLLLNSSWQAINIAEQLGGLDYGIEVF